MKKNGAIECNATTCRYNEKRHCDKNAILVGSGAGDAYCKSFKQNAGTADAMKMETAGEFAAHPRSVTVECTVESCRHYRDRYCQISPQIGSPCGSGNDICPCDSYAGK